jgi:arylsulfatase A-like enzyme
MPNANETPSRRRFLAEAGLASAGSLAVASAPGLAAEEPRRSTPNLLFILTDDQRWDMMGCAGNSIIHTPEMDRLAAGGVRFANMFVTTSICAASRASIFSGTWERTHRCTFGTPPLRQEFIDISYPKVLKQAGYRTGFVGKFGVGVPRGATGEMFDWFKPLGRHPYLKPQPDGSKRHLTDITGDHAIEFIRQSAKDGRPFCLSVSFNAPHAEDSDKRQYIWPKAMDDLYTDVTIPTPKTADPEFFESLPDFRKRSLNRIRWHWRFETPEMFQRMVKGHYRMISGVDAVVGRMRKELERLGLDDNTVIVLTGDNGYFLGERGFAGKWTGHEVSLRVPLVISDPRAPGGRRGVVPEPMALNVDIPPTLLDLAGVAVPEGVQGRSLAPILAGETPADWRTDFFHEHLFDHGKIPKYEGVRTQRYTYMRWFEQEPVYEQLFDNQADPHQEHNRADDPEYADVLARLRQRTDELRDRYGGPFEPWPKRRRKRGPTPKAEAASYVDGVKGKAAAFDGKATYLPLGKTPALDADATFTWSAWVYLDADATPPGVVLGNRALADGSDPTQFMKLTATEVQYFNGQAHSAHIRHRIPKETWAHVAIVKDGPKLTCYVNGKAAGSAQADFGVPELPLYAGGDPHAREFAPCRVDEVRLYDAALKPNAIQALHDLKDAGPKPLAHHPMEPKE